MVFGWILCGLGTFACFSGAWLFYRNIYDEKRSILRPILIMVAGILLIAIGTAKYLDKL